MYILTAGLVLIITTPITDNQMAPKAGKPPDQCNDFLLVLYQSWAFSTLWLHTGLRFSMKARIPSCPSVSARLSTITLEAVAYAASRPWAICLWKKKKNKRADCDDNNNNICLHTLKHIYIKKHTYCTTSIVHFNHQFIILSC